MIGRFELVATDGDAARRGARRPPTGVETPVFMPVGTQGHREGACCPPSSSGLGAQIVLGNTYHLYFRPGADVIAGWAACTGSWTGTARS